MLTGGTTSVDGATPNAQVSIAPVTTNGGIAFLLTAAAYQTRWQLIDARKTPDLSVNGRFSR
jgi:hypothetical protein